MFGRSNNTTPKGNNRRQAIQEYVDITEIKESTVILRDGSLRAVLAVSSVNFDLKSAEEQEAIIFAFQRFLNSVDFPIQIVVSSRKYNISTYLKKLKERSYVERNPLLKMQILDYIEFVSGLVEEASITSKYFYIVIPFYAMQNRKAGLWQKISLALNPRKSIFEQRELFETSKDQLLQRVEEVKHLLAGIGLNVAMLSTQELIELYYNYYNPSEFSYVSLAPTEELQLEENKNL